MFNKVILIGHLTRQIELRYLQNGNAIGNTAIAVTRKYTNAQGQKAEDTCFIDITFYGKQAETANQYLTKGSKLLIEGRLKFEQWTDNYNNNRSRHKIEVENMQMLGQPQQSNNSHQQGYQANQRQTPPNPRQTTAQQYQDDALQYADDDTIPF
ncbi:single-stranded DNA-binding protein [Campylobacter majalis]|uniref:single-stranded DNA-binding protein n=1 Tax=Campylobacter majalis TaxID=2790656 RepID=UPI003D68C220